MQEKLISTKEAREKARQHFNVKRFHGTHQIMQGRTGKYHLFIYKGDSFEVK